MAVRLATIPVLDPDILESAFQRHVLDEAVRQGWHIPAGEFARQQAQLAELHQEPQPLPGLAFHPRIMYRTEPGWPDLTLIRRRDRRLLWAELKREKGQLTPRQELVLDLLRSLETPPGSGLRVEVFVWRPSDWPTILEVLA